MATTHICVECNHEIEPGRMARGLCAACRWYITQHGDLEDYPRTKRKSWETAEDYLFIVKTHGGTLKDIAARMEISYDALWQALKKQGIRHADNVV